MPIRMDGSTFEVSTIILPFINDWTRIPLFQTQLNLSANSEVNGLLPIKVVNAVVLWYP